MDTRSEWLPLLLRTSFRANRLVGEWQLCASSGHSGASREASKADIREHQSVVGEGRAAGLFIVIFSLPCRSALSLPMSPGTHKIFRPAEFLQLRLASCGHRANTAE